MQHTTKYELNLIESGDAFSAKPLNDNAEKLEAALLEQKAETAAALSAEAAARQAADETQKAETSLALEKQQSATAAALDGLAAALGGSGVGEIPRIATGYYKGSGKGGKDNPNTIDFSKYGRLPKILLVTSIGFNRYIFATPDVTEASGYDSGSNMCYLTWTETAVSWYTNASTLYQLNSQYETYFYIAVF